MAQDSEGQGRPGAPRWLVSSSEVAGRVLVVAAAILALVWLLARLRLVLFPVFVALLLANVLVPPARWLRAHHWPSPAAAIAVVLGFLAIIGMAIAFVIPSVAEEFGDLGPTVSTAIDDLQDWAVDGPLGLEPEQVERFRATAGEQISEWAGGSSGEFVSGALLVGELIAGAILALVLTLYFVKDGEMMQQWALTHLPARHHGLARQAAARAWGALGAYTRGALLIGLFEAIVLGVTLLIVGSKLAAPVAVITFFAAFIPVVGAVVAGLVAVAVAFVSGGLSDALVVAVVALVVQQLDNDLLAPFVYGRIARLHPIVVLLSVTAGATLGGIGGAFLGVPVAAVAVAVGGVVWQHTHPTADSEPDSHSELTPDPATA